MFSRLPFRLCGTLFLLILLSVIRGFLGDEPKRHPAQQSPTVRLHLPDSAWMLADLDGDHHPDMAGIVPLGGTKDGYLYEVQLELTTGTPHRSIAVFHNNGLGLKITGLDIDGDYDIDLTTADRFF